MLRAVLSIAELGRIVINSIRVFGKAHNASNVVFAVDISLATITRHKRE